MARQIPLAPGLVAVVDDDCYQQLSQRGWVIFYKGYAVSFEWAGSQRTIIQMHQEVMRLHGILVPSGRLIDHANRNRLDNRFENLRICNSSQSNTNRMFKKKSKTGFRGVEERPSGMFRGYAKYLGKNYRTAQFTTPEEAAKARDELVTSLYGKFAILNY